MLNKQHQFDQYDLLDQQWIETEKFFQSQDIHMAVKIRTIEGGTLSLQRREGKWRICYNDMPILQASIEIRVNATFSIGELFNALIDEQTNFIHNVKNATQQLKIFLLNKGSE